MPTFGKYEAGTRLFLSGVGGVYTLKTDDKKAIKVLQPPLGIWADDRTQEEIDAFRLRAKTQKALAKTSKYWAPVYDTAAIRQGTEAPSGGGEAEYSGDPEAQRPPAGGAFAVMDRYERSAQSLIDGRVNLLNADLRHIISGVIQGLLDIKKTGRPHGNLKPSNILLNHAADLATANVHLTDPVADGGLTPASGEKDLADLGRILYHLVNLRPFDGGTIPRTRDWDDLGPNGEDWRKFCNALLDPHAPPADRDLEKNLPIIDTWRAKPKKSKTPMIAAAAFLILAVGGGLTYYLTRPPPVQWDQERWNVLNLEYHSWFEDFTNQMYNKQARDKFRKPPYPEQVVALLDAAGDLNDFDPAVIAQNKGIEWDQRMLNPTPRAMNPGAGPEATKKAVDLITGIEAALTPAKWPLLTRLDETAKRYESYGWVKPAEGIRKTIEDAKPPDVPAAKLLPPERVKAVNDWKQEHRETVIKSIDQTIAAASAVTTIDARWAKIEDQLPKLAAGDAASVPLLAGLKTFTEELPKSQATEDVTSLATSFGQIEALLNQLAAGLFPNGGEVVFSELAKDDKAKAAPSLESYAALVEIVPQYLKMKDDPRPAIHADWAAKRDILQTEMIDYIERAKQPQVQQQLDDLKQRRTAMDARIEAWNAIAPIEKNRRQLADAAKEVTETVALLMDDGNQRSAPFKVNPDEYVKEKHAYLTSGPLAKAIPVISAPWKAAFTNLLDKVEADKSRLRTDYQYKILVDKKFNDIDASYRGVDEAIPPKVEGLADVPGDPADWRHVIANRVANFFRENALKDIVAQLKIADDVPAVDEPSYVSFRTQRLKDFQSLRADAVAVISDYGTITDRLDHLDLRPDEPARGNPTYGTLFAKWRDSKSPLLADPQVAGALQPIADRVTALQAVDGLSDYKQIVADTQSAAPEIALASWRKLGAAALTEDLPALDDETKAQTALAADFAKLSQAKLLDDARLQTLNAEIAAQRPVRWHRWADTLASADNIRTALDHLKAFNVALTPQGDAPMLYYQALFALQDEFKKTPREADLKAPAQTFISTIGALPDSVSKNADVTAFITRMNKSLSTTPDESSNAGAGPQLAGWEVDNSKDGFRIFRSQDHKYTLEFAKMQVSEADSQKTIFLATTEMPLGLFIDTLNNSNRLDDLDNDKKPKEQQHWFKVPTAGNDVYLANGPRGWRIVSGKFTLNGAWLDDAGPLMTDKPYYPAQAIPQPPSPDDPLQLVSPWSAMFSARLLGCRLPTSEEWKAAYELFEAPAGKSLPKDIWNLRGENPKSPSWASQQAYAATMAGNGLKYPDQGMFLPKAFLFKSINGANAKPWTGDALAKLAPQRITSSPSPYQNSSLWFLEVGKEQTSTSQSLVMHHLVGNVAEFVFDGENGASPSGQTTVAAVVTDSKPLTATIDAVIADKKNLDKLCVIGGSSLSPPEYPFNEKQPLNMTSPQTAIGFADVGFRLAFTAPKENIVDVLATAFHDAKSLPGPRAKKG